MKFVSTVLTVAAMMECAFAQGRQPGGFPGGGFGVPPMQPGPQYNPFGQQGFGQPTQFNQQSFGCCYAMTADCLACAQGMTVDQFCRNPSNADFCRGIGSTGRGTDTTTTPAQSAGDLTAQVANLERQMQSLMSRIDALERSMGAGGQYYNQMNPQQFYSPQPWGGRPMRREAPTEDGEGGH